MATIRPARFPADARIVVALWREFIAASPVDLGYQGNAAELAELPGKYAAPDGCVLLARRRDAIVGCVAMRKAAPGICEMKRMFVRPGARGQGIGRRLAEHLIAEARAAGYSEMRLDVQAKSIAARTLYASIGFVAAEPISFNPVPGAAFLGLRL